MASFYFNYEETKFVLSDESKYIDWLTKLAQHHQVEVDELAYIFTSDDHVLEINREYLSHDYFTDIISFPLSENPISGDIFISVDRVKDNAETLGISFLEELHRVMARGLLHFIGFDDHSEEDIQEMRAQEEIAMKMMENE